MKQELPSHIWGDGLDMLTHHGSLMELQLKHPIVDLRGVIGDGVFQLTGGVETSTLGTVSFVEQLQLGQFPLQ